MTLARARPVPRYGRAAPPGHPYGGTGPQGEFRPFAHEGSHRTRRPCLMRAGDSAGVMEDDPGGEPPGHGAI